jgi:hypothetical protein
METETIEQLINKRVLYRRVGYDQRVIKLGPNREVIEGAAECERLWHINHVDGKPVLTIGRLDRPTCHLRRDYEGIWRGSWLEYERMPVEVIPEVEWKPTVDAIDPAKLRLLITVATGDSFRELLKYTGPLMEAYAKRIGADFVAITKPAQDWWGLEKFRVHPFAQAYERTLYVDADVFLTEETPDLFEVVPTGHVAMHDDWSQLPSFEWVFEERRNILQSQELPMDNSKSVLNTGVVMCDRKHASIWKPPLHPFFPTHCSEQFWIQNSARGLPFFQLPTEFNTQYWMPEFRKLLSTAKVVHLANCTPERRLEFARQFTSALASV